jgi:ornithine cyclodeaminase/alanine dehydrogenase-like protein (mu-crystallin family)
VGLPGGAPGRAADDEITLFESLGLAVEDLAAAALAYRRAEELGVGSWVDF